MQTADQHASIHADPNLSRKEVVGLVTPLHAAARQRLLVHSLFQAKALGSPRVAALVLLAHEPPQAGEGVAVPVVVVRVERELVAVVGLVASLNAKQVVLFSRQGLVRLQFQSASKDELSKGAPLLVRWDGGLHGEVFQLDLDLFDVFREVPAVNRTSFEIARRFRLPGLAIITEVGAVGLDHDSQLPNRLDPYLARLE